VQNNTADLTVILGVLGSARIKAACRMLMKLTPGVKFTNILRAAFLYLQFVFVIYWKWKKEINKKAAHEIMVKLTISILLTLTEVNLNYIALPKLKPSAWIWSGETKVEE